MAASHSDNLSLAKEDWPKWHGGDLSTGVAAHGLFVMLLADLPLNDEFLTQLVHAANGDHCSRARQSKCLAQSVVSDVIERRYVVEGVSQQFYRRGLPRSLTSDETVEVRVKLERRPSEKA